MRRNSEDKPIQKFCLIPGVRLQITNPSNMDPVSLVFLILKFHDPQGKGPSGLLNEMLPDEQNRFK